MISKGSKLGQSDLMTFRDLNEGIERGVRDVPTFFVNGEMVAGKATYENLSKDINAALKKVKKKAPVKQRA